MCALFEIILLHIADIQAVGPVGKVSKSQTIHSTTQFSDVHSNRWWEQQRSKDSDFAFHISVPSISSGRRSLSCRGEEKRQNVHTEKWTASQTDYTHTHTIWQCVLCTHSHNDKTCWKPFSVSSLSGLLLSFFWRVCSMFIRLSRDSLTGLFGFWSDWP